MKKLILPLLVMMIVFMTIFIWSEYSKSSFKKDNDWKNNTKQIVELGYLPDGKYRDFSINVSGEADIQETFYIISINNILNNKNEQSTKTFIKRNLSNKDNSIRELIDLYNSSVLLGLETEQLKEKLESEITHYNINDFEILTDEFNDTLFLLSEFQKIGIENEESINYLKQIEPLIYTNISDDNLYLLNPLLKLTKNNSNYTGLIKNIEDRINYLLKTENTYELWEIYQLTELISNLGYDNSLTNEEVKRIFKNNISSMSNMQLFYLLKINQVISGEVSEYIDIINRRIQNCKIIDGGYTYFTLDIQLPNNFSFFAIYINEYLGGKIDNKTNNKLYESIMNSSIDWRDIYSFLILIKDEKKKQDLRKEIKKIIETIKLEEVSFTVTDGFYFYKTMVELDISLNQEWLNNYKENMMKDLSKRSLSNSHLLYFYYSEMVKDGVIEKDLEIINNIKNEMKKSQMSEEGIYTREGIENILTTLFYLMINENLDIRIIDKENKKLFLKILEEYKYQDGGYSLVIGEKPDLFSTMIGVMLNQKLNGENIKIIF